MVRIDSGDAPARTNADGRFELGVSPARYQLLFLDPRTPGGPLARVPLELTVSLRPC